MFQGQEGRSGAHGIGSSREGCQPRGVGGSGRTWRPHSQLTALCHPTQSLVSPLVAKALGTQGWFCRPVRQRVVQRDKVRFCPSPLASHPILLLLPLRVPEMLASFSGPPSTGVSIHPVLHPIFVCFHWSAILAPSSSYLGP